MAIEGLKEVLGDAYTDEIGDKVSKLVGKLFVDRTDFNNQKKAADDLKKQLGERDTQIQTLQQSSGDLGALQKQLADQEKLHKAELAKVRMEGIAWRDAMKAGAKDPDTILLLAAKFLATAKMKDEDTIDGYDDFLKGLSEAEATASLFNTKDTQTVQVSGAQPANPGNKAGGDDSASYEARYAEARKNGNITQMVAIKNEAADVGIILN